MRTTPGCSSPTTTRRSGSASDDALEEAGCEVVAEADTAYVAVDLALRMRPDACLLDIAMPAAACGPCGRSSTTLPGVRCLMLTVSDSSADLFEALEAGAVGYLLKDAAPERVPEAVRSVLRGETVLSGPLTARVVAALHTTPATAKPVTNAHGRPVTFTNREADVLELLLTGASTAEIADAALRPSDHGSPAHRGRHAQAPGRLAE